MWRLCGSKGSSLSFNDANWIVGRAQGNMDGYDSSEEAEYVVNWRLLLLILSSALLTRVLHGFSDSLCQWVRLQSTTCLLEPFCPDERLCDGRLGFNETSRLHVVLSMELCVCPLPDGDEDMSTASGS